MGLVNVALRYIDKIEGAHIAKINNSQECWSCHHWLFNNGFSD